MSLQSINPATGEVIETFTPTSAGELDRILAADRILSELVTATGSMDLAAALVAVRRVELSRGWELAGQAPRWLIEAEMREVRA